MRWVGVGVRMALPLIALCVCTALCVFFFCTVVLHDALHQPTPNTVVYGILGSTATERTLYHSREWGWEGYGFGERG